MWTSSLRPFPDPGLVLGHHFVPHKDGLPGEQRSALPGSTRLFSKRRKIIVILPRLAALGKLNLLQISDLRCDLIGAHLLEKSAVIKHE